jgi:hypothetical protein
MEILARPLSQAHLVRAEREIEDWTVLIEPWGIELPHQCGTWHDHYLGSSRNGGLWALWCEDTRPHSESRSREAEGPRPEEIEFLLIDPPVQDRETISELLLRLHLACEEAKEATLCPSQVDAIASSVEFPSYRTVATYLPDAPESWLELSVRLVHAFDLSEHVSISKPDWDAYQRDSLEAALQVVLADREGGILVAYSLVATDVIPLMAWSVDWPLSRRGKNSPTRRGSIQGVLPWETEPDCGLLTLYQRVPLVGSLAPNYFGDPTARLMVGGRTPEEAVENWERCASAFRRMKRRVDIPSGTPLSWRRAGSGNR